MQAGFRHNAVGNLKDDLTHNECAGAAYLLLPPGTEEVNGATVTGYALLTYTRRKLPLL